MKTRSALFGILKPGLAVAGLGLVALFASETAVVADCAGVCLASTPREAVLRPIPAGETQIGEDTGPPDEAPAFREDVPAFLLDANEVTVAQFAAFVEETGYRTDAERAGEGAVFDVRFGAWTSIEGAHWRRPQGPSGPEASRDHPVTQVSWRDADAFCRAYGARLPTELEWERAARLGQTEDGSVFRAGDSVEKDNAYRANVWQGFFPIENEGKDGYRLSAPVGSFGVAPSGLSDMAGNVWEWTASWYRPYASRDRDLRVSATDQRVQRGGSYLCDPDFCQGFRVSAREHSTPDSALENVGFRCAADPAPLALAGQVLDVQRPQARSPRETL